MTGAVPIAMAAEVSTLKPNAAVGMAAVGDPLWGGKLGRQNQQGQGKPSELWQGTSLSDE